MTHANSAYPGSSDEPTAFDRLLVSHPDLGVHVVADIGTGHWFTAKLSNDAGEICRAEGFSSASALERLAAEAERAFAIETNVW